MRGDKDRASQHDQDERRDAKNSPSEQQTSNLSLLAVLNHPPSVMICDKMGKSLPASNCRR